MRNRFNAWCFGALLMGGAGVGFAQEFEVASVKIATSGFNGVRGGCRGIDTKYTAEQIGATPPLGRCLITDGRLSHLIGIAYGVSMAQIKDAPDWVIANAERYNVDAKVADPSTVKEPELLQAAPESCRWSRDSSSSFIGRRRIVRGWRSSLGKELRRFRNRTRRDASIKAPKVQARSGRGYVRIAGVQDWEPGLDSSRTCCG